MELALLKLALERIGQKIGGDWLLLGGSLVRITADESRGTEDLDIVRIDKEEGPKERSVFIQEMKSLNLSPEQVNSAVYYFLKQVPDWHSQIVLLKTYDLGRIYRPTVTLFAFLKLQRGTPIDRQDVESFMAAYPQEAIDQALLKSWLSEYSGDLLQRAQAWKLL